MERFIKLLFGAVCILFTVSCKTVTEEETKKEKNVTVTDYGGFQKTTKVDFFGDTTWSMTGDATAMYKHLWGDDYQQDWNENCKEMVSVFPNPTSSFATINVDFSKSKSLKLGAMFDFEYKLIFDQKVIYEGYISKPESSQIIIPEHLLQKGGTYIVAYDIYWLGGNVLFCQNTVNFMVMKSK